MRGRGYYFELKLNDMTNYKKIILATQDDINSLKKALEIVRKQETTDDTHVDWANSEIQFAIMRVINNLENCENYFQVVSDNEVKYYDAECGNCGWWGSSQWLQGGGAIADTGDHSDVVCPVCEKPID
jgi:hypothetical protein